MTDEERVIEVIMKLDGIELAYKKCPYVGNGKSPHSSESSGKYFESGAYPGKYFSPCNAHVQEYLTREGNKRLEI